MMHFIKILLILLLFQNIAIAQEKNKLPPDIQAAIERCSECHGVDGEKPALNRSDIINELSKEEFLFRVRGYIKGTYGGELKAFMRSRIACLNKRQIEAIAAYYTQRKVNYE